MTKHVTSGAGLLEFLFASCPDLKKSKLRSLLKHQAISVNGSATTKFDHPLRPGDVVKLHLGRHAAPGAVLPCGIRSLHEDAHILVINKPSGLLSVSGNDGDERTAYFFLTDYVRATDPRARIWIVHRLDRETSGVMVFARTPEAKETLQSGWESVEKHYEAIVEGHPPQKEGTMDCHLDETNPFIVRVAKASSRTRQAITHYRVLAQDDVRSLVRLELETGRRHQIRVQLATEGCPILGDLKYGALTNPARRLALHATKLSFLHPHTRKPFEFVSPLPPELRAVAPSLR